MDSSGPQPRLWIFVWLLALVPVWVHSLHTSYDMVLWARQAPPVCSGLDYEALRRAFLPGETTVAFATDAVDFAGAERFFCAQYDLAPRVLVYWRNPTASVQKVAPGTVVVAQFDDPAAREELVRALTAEAGRQGRDLRRAEPVSGILVLRVGDG